ncbi:antibiotic biosynthesis monooxygenase [Geobacter sp. FeAm09]|uniref:putative quinol monooxygenase n=1 Tax=Geobacter sp. FeAm09 TaxID=2597769 RepID=UPI0011EE6804|nr:putative quinol monooxygenase [Geobacter sp. FeAm09]QEM67487.1 antibiotic biosynthesis monooxygenase [Geobacter sp. FeAm09]
MPSITVVARIVAKKEAAEEVKNELLKVRGPTRREEGCLGYDLHRDNENPAEFIMYESWKDGAHLERHMDSPHFNALITAIDDLTEELTVSKLTPLA